MKYVFAHRENRCGAGEIRRALLYLRTMYVGAIVIVGRKKEGNVTGDAAANEIAVTEKRAGARPDLLRCKEKSFNRSALYLLFTICIICSRYVLSIMREHRYKRTF